MTRAKTHPTTRKTLWPLERIILDQVKDCPAATYIIRNRANAAEPNSRYETCHVVKVLQTLEQAGLVRRTPTAFPATAEWQLVPEDKSAPT